jgi:hypothetical protein
MFIGVWASRRRGEEKWQQFLDRYHNFLSEDVVELCAHHHAAIHQIYDRIIQADVAKVERPLSQYTWRQAERLMDRLKGVCLEWLCSESSGIDPIAFTNRRHKRRARKNASQG